MKKPFAVIPVERIQRSIYLVRGQKVMLDAHLALLYDVETRVLNQAVKRNRERFPGDFMFKLTREEILGMSQTVISLPALKFSKQVHVFTEQGVAMLSGVLNSPRAVQVNIAIMRAFVQLRQVLSGHAELARKFAELERRITGHDEAIRSLFAAIRQLMAPPKKPRREIGFHAIKPAPKP
jgi:hypothetical protein